MINRCIGCYYNDCKENICTHGSPIFIDDECTDYQDSDFIKQIIEDEFVKVTSCIGCKHDGQWENEIEYGYPSPCTRCSRRCADNYEVGTVKGAELMKIEAYEEYQIKEFEIELTLNEYDIDSMCLYNPFKRGYDLKFRKGDSDIYYRFISHETINKGLLDYVIDSIVESFN